MGRVASKRERKSYDRTFGWSMSLIINAMEYHSPLMQGTSKPHIIVDDNHDKWVVKSASSSQGSLASKKLLFNEMFATFIAEHIGLPVVPARAMDISKEFLEEHSHLKKPDFGSFKPGLHFASQHIDGHSLSALGRAKQSHLANTTINFPDANGIISFDSWSNNRDRAWENLNGSHQENHGNLMFRTMDKGLLEMKMIDFGLSFSGDWHCSTKGSTSNRVGKWAFELLGHYDIFFACKWVDSADCKDWSNKIKDLPYSQLEELALQVPYEWRTTINLAQMKEFLLYLISRGQDLKDVIEKSLPKAKTNASLRA
jgi:hypothetical protein